MQRKNIIRSALLFGLFMALFSIIRNLVAAHDLTTEIVIKIIAVGLVSGLIAATLYGVLISLFLRSKFIKQGGKFDKDADEEILFEGLANHFKKLEAVGGKIYLTNRRLVFISHKVNIQNHQLFIDLTDILFVERYKTLGIVNNGISVQTKEEITEKFVVNEAKELTEKLSNILSTRRSLV